ncbi:MAG: glycosyltransferase family 2 protein [Bacteroidota bacterium]
MNLPVPEISFHPCDHDHSHSLFSIVIPSWNNLAYLKLCIRSIEANSSYKHQVIVHVNEGTDGTLQWVKEKGYDYTHSPQNSGVCYGVNAAAQLTRTDYIVYFNDDMYACPGWDKVMQDAIKQNGTELFYYSGTMIEYEAGTNKATLSPHDFGRDIATFNEQQLLDFCATSANKQDWFGASWPPSIVHKNTWNKAGGYSEEYSPGFYSDPDFSMKLWMAGVRDFKGLGKSLVYHFKCKSTGRVQRNNGRKTFMKKWGFTPSYLYKNIIKVGEPFNTHVPLVFNKGFSYLVSMLKAKLA